MIGSGLKKYALANGMKVDSGVAYGSLRGYAVTMSEGAGYKQMVIATRFTDPEQQNAFGMAVGAVNVTSQYRVQSLKFAPNGINVVFADTVGTMKKIEEFVNWMFPLLEQHGAAKVHLCNECGMAIPDDGVWILRDGVAAFHVHSACGQALRARNSSENEQRLQEAEGSYVTGAVGALLGAALGAVVWGLVLMIGFVASLVGLLIGFLAEKGYTLLKGKQGKAKVAILIVAVIVGVLLGTMAGTVLQVVQVMNQKGVDMEYFQEFLEIVLDDSDVQGEILGNAVMGILFAGIGVFSLLKNESKKVTGEKITVLK